MIDYEDDDDLDGWQNAQKKKRQLQLIAIVFVLVVSAGVVWYFTSQKKTGEADAVVQTVESLMPEYIEITECIFGNAARSNWGETLLDRVLNEEGHLDVVRECLGRAQALDERQLAVPNADGTPREGRSGNEVVAFQRVGLYEDDGINLDILTGVCDRLKWLGVDISVLAGQYGAAGEEMSGADCSLNLEPVNWLTIPADAYGLMRTTLGVDSLAGFGRKIWREGNVLYVQADRRLREREEVRIQSEDAREWTVVEPPWADIPNPARSRDTSCVTETSQWRLEMAGLELSTDLGETWSTVDVALREFDFIRLGCGGSSLAIVVYKRTGEERGPVSMLFCEGSACGEPSPLFGLDISENVLEYVRKPIFDLTFTHDRIITTVVISGGLIAMFEHEFDGELKESFLRERFVPENPEIPIIRQRGHFLVLGVN